MLPIPASKVRQLSGTDLQAMYGPPLAAPELQREFSAFRCHEPAADASRLTRPAGPEPGFRYEYREYRGTVRTYAVGHPADSTGGTMRGGRQWRQVLIEPTEPAQKSAPGAAPVKSDEP
jgi:hypothetical protein